MTKIRVGFHGFEPALESMYHLSSAGASVHTQAIWNAWEAAGFEVVPLFRRQQLELPSFNTFIEMVKSCDIIFFFWRWDFPFAKYPEDKYDTRRHSYNHQMSIIDVAIAHGVKIVIHDQDHMISDKDLAKLRLAKAVLTEPSLFPRLWFQKLMFPISYQFHGRANNERSTLLGYIGNNYGRYEEFATYLRHKNLAPKVWGNWLEPSHERESPTQVIQDFPLVQFQGRLPSDKIINTLHDVVATIHLAKPSYNNVGFMTMRWAEAAVAGCLGFVPFKFRLPFTFTSKLQYNLGWLRVRSAGELSYKLEEFARMSDDERNLIQANQYRFVADTMTIEPWVTMVLEETQ